MKTSAAGREAISKREANKLKAYKDSVGIWTIGVGHTSAAGPPHVTAGMTITAAQSDEILSRDLAKFEKAVNSAVKAPISQHQFDALVSLAFNIGGGAFAKSTLVKKLNKGDYIGASDAFMAWNKAGGKTVKGLTTRRDAERRQFLSGRPATLFSAPVPAPLPAAPPPSPIPPPADKATIETVQKRLTDLGYNPGGIDGKVGPLTTGAILSFKNDNNLPPTDVVDEAMLTAMAVAKPRKMAPERANATVAEVAAKVPEANVHWWNRLGAGVLGGSTAVGGAVEYIAPATGYLSPIKDFVADVPPYVWIGGVVLVAVALYFASQYGANKAKEAFQSGERR